MGATKDGRCWACVQRRRWYSEEEVVQLEQDGLRHLALDGVALCELPRRGRSRDPQVAAGYTRKHRAKRLAANPEGYRWARRHRQRNSELLRLYGITWSEWEALWIYQAGRCACCWQDPPEHVDHDHATGAVRGLLCQRCNLMLGQAQDDPDRLRAGIKYLN